MTYNRPGDNQSEINTAKIFHYQNYYGSVSKVLTVFKELILILADQRES